MDAVGRTLRALRVQAQLTQKQVARALSRQLKPITHQAVSKWETGDAQPNVQQFLALCRLYGVRDVTATFLPDAAEGGLNAEGLRKLREYEELLRRSGLFTQQAPVAPAAPAPCRTLRLYHLPASAGTGQLLDGDGYELVEVDDTVPQNADFGVRLAGDSMQPRFADGQVVWVKEQPTLESGQIGLFLYDGEAYCKQLEVEGGRVLLQSLNPRYAPIAVAQPEALKVFGRVVG